MARVAIFTFGVLREAEGHPQVQGFYDSRPGTFAAAERSDGFIDRSRLDPETNRQSWGEWVHPQFYREGEHPYDPRTLSLWADLESLFAFVYAGIHDHSLRQRQEWFIPPAWPVYVVWWVPGDHTPDWHEAVARHAHLHDRGPSPYAFDLRHPFGPDEQPVVLDRALVQAKMARNAGSS